MLRPGGRISLFEPINRLTFPEAPDRFWGYDVSPVIDLAAKVKARFEDLQEPAAATMMDFDDRDLVRLAEGAGFVRMHLECHLDVEPGSLMRAVNLDTLLDTAPNPLAPTVREVLAAALTGDEQDRFLGQLQDAITGGHATRRSAVAYLTAYRSS